MPTRRRAVRRPQTLREHVLWGAREFRRARLYFGHGTADAQEDAYQLVVHALRLPHELPEAALEQPLSAAQSRRVLALLRRRLRTREPAAYLTGEAWFAGLPFHVDRRVLVPRSPIAELIEARFSPWLGKAPRRVLDLCAGSGCIGIACAYAFPRARVDLGELDAGALAVARRNVARHRLRTRVRALRSDLFAALPGPYGLIVSNPPYVPTAEWRALPAEYHREPRRALDAGRDGMDLVARILREAPQHLESGGLLVCEIGGSQREFDRRFPRFPGTWAEFERGGDGVFIITREELAAWLKENVRVSRELAN